MVFAVKYIQTELVFNVDVFLGGGGCKRLDKLFVFLVSHITARYCISPYAPDTRF